MKFDSLFDFVLGGDWFKTPKLKPLRITSKERKSRPLPEMKMLKQIPVKRFVPRQKFNSWFASNRIFERPHVKDNK